MSTPVSLQQLQGGTAVAPRKPPTLRDMLERPETKAGLQKVAGKLLRADRIVALAVNALSKTPDLAKCHPRTVLGAIMASTALGLEFNTSLGHAYLIPYKRRVPIKDDKGRVQRWEEIVDCQFQVGYKGYNVLANRSDFVDSLEANAVYRNDHFKHMMGSHRFVEFAVNTDADRGELRAAYCLTKHGSDELATVLPAADVFKIRERSETYRYLRDQVAAANASGKEKDIAKAQEKFAATPWVLWEDVMAGKSAIKRHCSARLPLQAGDALASGVILDGAGDVFDGDVIDLSAMAEPEVAAAVVSGDAEPPTIEHQAPDEILQTTVETARETVTQEAQRSQTQPTRQPSQPSGMME